VSDAGGLPDAGRPRAVATVLDVLRRRIDHDAFDAVLFSVEAVAAGLAHRDTRQLPGSIAWIDQLRGEGKRIGLLTSGEHIAATPELVEMADRFDVVEGSRPEQLVLRALDELDVESDRAVVVATDPRELEAARAAGVALRIGLERGNATPEELRLAGADAVVADLQELLGPT
jgi:phosphoglycolate phosphatase-like HAD superfamily hydrolase